MVHFISTHLPEAVALVAASRVLYVPKFLFSLIDPRRARQRARCYHAAVEAQIPVNRPVRTRMRGVGGRSQSLPSTRLAGLVYPLEDICQVSALNIRHIYIEYLANLLYILLCATPHTEIRKASQHFLISS